MFSKKNTLWDNFLSAWKIEWQLSVFRYQFIFTVPILIVSIVLYTDFLHYNEGRPGVVLYDPLFALFSPIDLTWFIFVAVYSFSICGFIALLWEPQRLLFGFQIYIAIALLRVLSIYLVPLEPAPTMIPMEEPVVQFLVNSKAVVEKDLFFSGHTSTLFLFFLLAYNRTLRIVLLIGTALVGGFLILQHVHYTIDILAAPIASYFAYRMVILAQSRVAYPLRG